MLYHQPYGISDPNGAYINGNPSTGTMGSIPPAASIEYPQREIVNFISDARGTPSDADLHQLAKAVQSGQVIYSDDAGTVNQVVVTPSPPVLALVKGMVFVSKILNGNTAPSTLKVNNLAPVPIVHVIDGSPLNAGDLVQNALQAFGFDGTNFQMIWSMASGGGGGMPVYLQAPKDFYVDATIGIDTLDGTTPTLSGTHGPFKTIQKACNQIPLYNLNGYQLSIHVANGSYANFNAPAVNGSGAIGFYGNHTSPQLVGVQGVGVTAALIGTRCAVVFDGFALSTSGPSNPGDPVCGLASVYPGTQVLINAIVLGSCTGEQLRAQRGASLGNFVAGSPWLSNGGGAASFMAIDDRSSFERNANGGPAITITGPISYSIAFLSVALQCWTQLIYSSLSVTGGVSGLRYSVAGNSTIQTAGGGPNYYPGTVAGFADTTSGGYYT